MRLKTRFFKAGLLCVFAFLTCKTTPPPELAEPPADAAPVQDSPEAGEPLEVEELGDDFADLELNLARLPESEFAEVWGYVVAKSERDLKTNYPVTDVVYFGAEVDRYGSIVEVPRRKNLPRFAGRVHVSIICTSAGLTHFILEPESKARRTFFNELLAMTQDYDGLNIDLENVPLRDAGNFLSLLQELKEALGEKVLSVCVPARENENQTYNYKNIAKVADKVFVMAYDEHWSGSSPGPIASMRWCKNVASYALKTIGAKKLVMGIPFYGRSWANKATARALIAPTTNSIMKENHIDTIERDNGVPHFTYEVNVRVTLYFEDAYSLATRMDMYQNQGVNNVGFWRIGQEDTAIWSYIKIRKTEPASR
jgi:spore germination protein YaaH